VTHHALLAARRLPCVLDLDETLLHAVALPACERNAHALAQRAAAAPPDSPRRAALEADLGRLLADAQLLSEYALTDAVTVGGSRLAARPEGDEGAQRPVLRLPAAGVVLTRIDPGRRETSMLVRIRPGWEELRAWLLGDDRPSPAAAPRPAPRARFDVFVCTLSEKAYAHEMVRLLDPAARLIAAPARERRIVTVPGADGRAGAACKTLRGALGGGREAAAAPLALVVDDRPDVWEEAAQSRLVPVAPFTPYAAAESADGSGAAGAGPLACVRAQLEACRGQFFRALDERYVPRVAAAAAAAAAAQLPRAPPEVEGARARAGAAAAAAACEPPPARAGDPWRGDVSAHVAAVAAAVAGAGAGAAFAAAITAASAAPPPAGRASSRSALGHLDSDIGMALQPQASLAGPSRPFPGAAPLAGPAEPPGPFQQIRLEAERRGTVVDWEVLTEGPGSDRRFTAILHFSGRQLATGIAPTRRGAQDMAAARAMEKLRAEAEAEAGPASALGPDRLARMAGLQGCPGADKGEVTPDMAITVLSIYWERLETEAREVGGVPPPGGLDYRMLPDSAPPRVAVELWAGEPARPVARGEGPARRDATQRAAMAALRQEGFLVAAEVAAAAAAAAPAPAVAAAAAPPAKRAAEAAAEEAVKKRALVSSLADFV